MIRLPVCSRCEPDTYCALFRYRVTCSGVKILRRAADDNRQRAPQRPEVDPNDHVTRQREYEAMRAAIFNDALPANAAAAAVPAVLRGLGTPAAVSASNDQTGRNRPRGQQQQQQHAAQSPSVDSTASVSAASSPSVHHKIDAEHRKVQEQAAKLQQKGSARILEELTRGMAGASVGRANNNANNRDGSAARDSGAGRAARGAGSGGQSGNSGQSAGRGAKPLSANAAAYDPDFDRSRTRFEAKPFAHIEPPPPEPAEPAYRSYEEEFPTLGGGKQSGNKRR